VLPGPGDGAFVFSDGPAGREPTNGAYIMFPGLRAMFASTCAQDSFHRLATDAATEPATSSAAGSNPPAWL
jgi:hypothetical protein